MKKKIKLKILILFFCINFSILAQNNENLEGVVSGRILDDTSAPLPFANINIYNLEKKILVGSIAFENGKFEINNLPLQKLILEISYTGFKTFSKEIILDANTKKYNVRIVKLELDASVLNEVLIQKEKSAITFKRDKKVFTIGKDLLAQSNSALGILENIPSVTVDANGQVSLRGNPNVIVLVNGRQSGLTLNNALDQIPAINIENIEVITNPSASFQASGSAGILNIVLKKNKKEGIIGQVSLMSGAPIDSRIGSSLNYKNNKINLFATVGLRYTDYVGTYSSNQIYNPLGLNTSLKQTENENRNDEGKSFYGGFDYFINDKNTITAAYNINNTKDTDNSTLNYNYLNDNKLDSLLVRNGNSLEKRSYNQLELNYLKTFNTKDRKLTIDFQYDFWNSNKDWIINTTKILPTIENSGQLRTNTKNGNKDFVLQTDYAHPISEKSKIEFGLKGELRNVANVYLAENFIGNEWFIFNGLNNDLKYNETISAAYIQYGNEIGKFNYLLGVRNENTLVKINDTNQLFVKNIKYSNLFPTLHLAYNFTEKTSVQLSYSKRINRPSIWILNPFNEIKDFTFQTVGNPDLNPAYTNAFEIQFNKNFENLSISSSTYYHRTKDFFQNYVYQDSNQSFVSKPINLNLENRFGLETSINYSPIKMLKLFSNFNYYGFSQEGIFESQNYNFSNRYWEFQFRSQIKLPKEINFQCFIQYQGENRNSQTLTNSQYYVNVSLNKNFLSNKLTIAFNATNIFDSRIENQLTTNQNYLLNRISSRNAERFNFNMVYRFSEKQFKIRNTKEGNRN
ncbi:outer membrane beta-barrel family protein [Flavobacterium sp.]|uniref:outer membrane beta-barrel family protein n=1 Tax=Flavobacterium sp. TaxID=239 RepID=UPI00286E08DE|nr:outer membrane beta-barrel family protein [Flavobacterium sp.]